MRVKAIGAVSHQIVLSVNGNAGKPPTVGANWLSIERTVVPLIWRCKEQSTDLSAQPKVTVTIANGVVRAREQKEMWSWLATFPRISATKETFFRKS